MEKKIVWRYGAKVYGIKKRCRNVAWHHTDKNELGEGVQAPDADEAKRLAQLWIDKNMKSYTKAFASVTRWEIDGISESWEPFNDADNLKWELSVETLNA